MLTYTYLMLWCIALVSCLCKNDVEIICYWGSWSSYRPDIGKFTSQEIDPRLCTRIIYSFAGLNKNLEIQSIDEWNDIKLGGYKNVTSLKKDYPCLKISLALGGWNEGSIKYSVMASTAESREAFAKVALKYLVYYDFDGIDIDWEYPTGRGGIKQDKENFVAFLKAVKDAVSPWGITVSTAVSIEDGLVGSAYDIAGIASTVDFVHLMAYDYITTSSSVTGLSSPLSAIKNTVNQWLQNGMSSKKLILGIPSYARTFKLKDPASNGIGAPTMGVAEPGPYTMEAGFMAYYEILDLRGLDKFNEVENDDTIYAYHNDEWYTYENEKSIQTKAKFALKMNLGGVMFWSLDTDDFRGIYGHRYPLLEAVNDIIHNNNK